MVSGTAPQVPSWMTTNIARRHHLSLKGTTLRRGEDSACHPSGFKRHICFWREAYRCSIAETSNGVGVLLCGNTHGGGISFGTWLVKPGNTSHITGHNSKNITSYNGIILPYLNIDQRTVWCYMPVQVFCVKIVFCFIPFYLLCHP